MGFLSGRPPKGGTGKTLVEHNTPSRCPRCGYNLSDPTATKETSEKELIQYYINTLENAHGLTEWENNFISSVTDQFTKRGSLSPRQLETLKKIYEDKGA